MNTLPAIFDVIRQLPNHEPHWLALAGWFHDNGQDDFAAIVRQFWSALRDNLASGVSLEETLRLSPTYVKLLAQLAREVEGRSLRKDKAK